MNAIADAANRADTVMVSVNGCAALVVSTKVDTQERFYPEG